MLMRFIMNSRIQGKGLNRERQSFVSLQRSKMSVMRFDLPDLCDCGRCGPRKKCVCGPTIVEKRTRCGSVTRKVGTYHVNHCGPAVTTTTTVMPQVYLDYPSMCEVWYPHSCPIELTKINPLTYQIGIPETLRGKLRIRVDMIQDCPTRRRKEETYTINLTLDDE